MEATAAAILNNQLKEDFNLDRHTPEIIAPLGTFHS